jgi:hypothetical protein
MVYLSIYSLFNNAYCSYNYTSHTSVKWSAWHYISYLLSEGWIYWMLRLLYLAKCHRSYTLRSFEPLGDSEEVGISLSCNRKTLACTLGICSSRFNIFSRMTEKKYPGICLKELKTTKKRLSSYSRSSGRNSDAGLYEHGDELCSKPRLSIPHSKNWTWFCLSNKMWKKICRGTEQCPLFLITRYIVRMNLL